jgi:hypothetical protein
LTISQFKGFFINSTKYPLNTNAMTCEQAKRISIVEFLQNLNFKPAKVTGNDHWYLSPFRKEKTPSFKVNQKLNLWYDHGLGKGGDLIDLGCLVYDCNIKDLLVKLGGENLDFSFQQQLKPNSEKDSGILIEKTSFLQDPALIHYLLDRSIPKSIACLFCVEVTYKAGDNRFKAIGFKNSDAGYELRSPNFKGSSRPKSYTYIDNGCEIVSVFEGFTDFLSGLVLKNELSLSATNFLVLNSLALFERARPIMEKHKEVHLYLDDDQAGKSCLKYALTLKSLYQDKSYLYRGRCKDLNEFLIQSSCEKVQAIKQRVDKSRGFRM